MHITTSLTLFAFTLSWCSFITCSPIKTPTGIVANSSSTGCTKEERIRGAQLYVNGTVAHSSSLAAEVPLEDGAIRYETFNGIGPIQTAFNAQGIRDSLVVGPQAFTVTGLKEASYSDSENGNGTVTAIYDLYAGLPLPNASITLTTSRIVEVFLYSQNSCQIHELQAWITIPGA